MLADRYDAFLFDLDGVLYLGGEPAPMAAEAVDRLRKLGKQLAFVTNNSSRTPEAVVEQLRSVGIEAEVEEVETSSLATAEVLGVRGVATCFVVGEEGLRKALTDQGIRILDGEPSSVDAVVVGWDRKVDYAKFRTASGLVHHGASLVATNADASYPSSDGRRWPGTGALLAVIEVTTGAQAEVIGKPNPAILEAALKRAGGGRPLLVGDRIDTDIEGAARLGWDSLLVLTGVSNERDALSANPRPTYVGGDLSILFDVEGGADLGGMLKAGSTQPSGLPKGLSEVPMHLRDVRKTIEATIESLTPERAQKLAKSFLEPGSAKEQVAKTATELMEWSQRSREKLREFVAHEVARQMKAVGVATQSEVDSLKKRVRQLERGTGGQTAKRSGAKSAAKSAARAAKASSKTVSIKTAAPPATG